MFRWNQVTPVTIDQLTVKMYREPFEPLASQNVPYEARELDHYAYRHLNSELYMYKILDTNFVRLMEERFDLDRVRKIRAPTKEAL